MALDDVVSRREFLKAGIVIGGSLIGLNLFPEKSEAKCFDDIISYDSTVHEYDIVKETGKHPVLGVMVRDRSPSPDTAYYVLTSNDGKVFAHIRPEGPGAVNLIYENDENVRLEVLREKQWGYREHEFHWGVAHNEQMRTIDAQWYIERGNDFYDRGCWKRATNAFRHAAIINPRDAYTWLRLVVSYNRIGDYKNSLQVEKTGKKFNPDSSWLTIERINEEIRNAKRK